MSTKAMTEAKVRITLLLLIWALICLTSFSGRSSLLRSKLKAEVSPQAIIDYFASKE